MAALPNANGLKPWCEKKLRSSNCIRQVINLGGMYFDSGNRHCSSSAMRAASNLPLLSSNTVEVCVLNNGDGKQNKNQINKTLAISVSIPFLLKMKINMLLGAFRIEK